MNYITYKCYDCNKTFILLADEVTHSLQESKYISCPYHGKHKRIYVTGKYDGLKDCMDHDSHKKINGKIVQKRWAKS